jgi:hypothetical protein
MARKNTAVLGVYPNYSSVENAVDVLKEAGFRNTDISVLFPEKAGSPPVLSWWPLQEWA